jgi:hypothetical protein
LVPALQGAGSAVEVTAQAMYAALVKDVLSPGFRDLGLKGSGGRYALAAPGFWALMSLQKSVYSDATAIQFTVNLLAANMEAWDAARAERPYLPQRPAAGVVYGEPTAWTRIGTLTPEGADKWWRIHAEVDQAEVTAEVLHDVREFALPWLREQVRERG